MRSHSICGWFDATSTLADQPNRPKILAQNIILLASDIANLWGRLSIWFLWLALELLVRGLNQQCPSIGFETPSELETWLALNSLGHLRTNEAQRRGNQQRETSNQKQQLHKYLNTTQYKTTNRQTTRDKRASKLSQQATRRRRQIESAPRFATIRQIRAWAIAKPEPWVCV